MSVRDTYHLDLWLAFLFRLILFVGMVGLGAYYISSRDDGRSKSITVDLGVKGVFTPGADTGTRNQIPHGGIDEKSGTTPTKSTH
jgi:type IV secretory pathway TrbL component